MLAGRLATESGTRKTKLRAIRLQVRDRSPGPSRFYRGLYALSTGPAAIVPHVNWSKGL
ncbi:hypothetical protein SBA5_620005 [Candidatus Sulfotelmatomonas gaucii]|uniref:Uncharacterized protein n=1 Tax=Candidatus Sulfuritelmatomonas gaucii TaxID=2043161 RepID=A0A2N9LXQ9_9BACT|nr:hypothetical protein SBA5_620005 [Candidatus Sulfotelmatomonas gaucii]